jgi:hypothetical protein
MNAELLGRMRKVLELARRGHAGEKQSAERMLELLMCKHGITINDIDSPEREWCIFKKCDKIDSRLLSQIVSKVQNSRSINRGSLRGKECFKATPVEQIEIMFLFDIYRPALRKEIKDVTRAAYIAFTHVNKIFADNDESDSDNVTKLTPTEIVKARQLAEDMNPVRIHKQLPGGTPCR